MAIPVIVVRRSKNRKRAWILWCSGGSILQTLGAAEILEQLDQPSVSSAWALLVQLLTGQSLKQP